MSVVPDISVAVIELSGRNFERVIDGFERAALKVEYLIACQGTAPQLGTDKPVRVLTDAGETIPERRLTALNAAQSDWVVLIEDTTLVTDRWIDEVNRLIGPKAGSDHQRTGAFWGPVKIDSDLPARYRALGAMEYGRFGGEAPVVGNMPGNCMIFRRDAVQSILTGDDTGIVEHAVSPRLAHAGWSVEFRSDLISIYAGADTYGAQLSTRFSHGRLHAARRYPRTDRAAHLKSAARAVLVPLVLTVRAARHLFDQIGLGRNAHALIWVMLMSTAWGTGEFTGHLIGEGASAKSWR